MRFRVRKFAHMLERVGLAMAGAACGLFVSAHVGSSISFLTTQGFLLFMMIAGAAGFYLGIDTPPLPLPLRSDVEPARSAAGIDTAEFLSAVGTFLATLTAFFSVGIIVLRAEPDIAWTVLIGIGWTAGIAMQIVAGAIARGRA
jgi:hypothetical protein